MGNGLGIARSSLAQGAHSSIASSILEAAVSCLAPSSNTTHSCVLSSPATIEPNPRTLLTALYPDGQKADHIVFTAGPAIDFKPLATADAAYSQALGTMCFLTPNMLANIAGPYPSPGPTSSLTPISSSISPKSRHEGGRPWRRTPAWWRIRQCSTRC